MMGLEAQTNPFDFLTLLSQYGWATAALIVIVIGGMRGEFLYRKVHEAIVGEVVRGYEATLAELKERLTEWQQRYAAMEQDRNQWKDVALRAMAAAEHVTQQGAP